MKVANVMVKCPICGETKSVTEIEFIPWAGLDPLMKKYYCNGFYWERNKPIYQAKQVRCNTYFYVAPSPKYVEEKVE